jgi:hypothetical protein
LTEVLSLQPGIASGALSSCLGLDSLLCLALFPLPYLLVELPLALLLLPLALLLVESRLLGFLLFACLLFPLLLFLYPYALFFGFAFDATYVLGFLSL